MHTRLPGWMEAGNRCVFSPSTRRGRGLLVETVMGSGGGSSAQATAGSQEQAAQPQQRNDQEGLVISAAQTPKLAIGR